MGESIIALLAGLALLLLARRLGALAIGITPISLQRYSEPVIHGVVEGTYRWVFRLLGLLLCVVGLTGLVS